MTYWQSWFTGLIFSLQAPLITISFHAKPLKFLAGWRTMPSSEKNSEKKAIIFGGCKTGGCPQVMENGLLTDSILEPKTNDNVILARIRNGDRHAFKLLFTKYFVKLCCLADNITKSEALAKEAVQQVYVNLWERRQKLYVETSLVAYLARSAKNNALNLVKRDKTRQGYEQAYALDRLAAEEDAGWHQEQPQMAALVNEGINQLPPKCREIYVLCKKDGLTYDEIADYLNVSPKTVENQMGIAMKKLREYIKTRTKSLL